VAFFERKPWGNAPPPGNKIKIEEKQLKRRTYSRRNQWLGSKEDWLRKQKITELKQREEGAV
jgi:hypothetical protein